MVSRLETFEAMIAELQSSACVAAGEIVIDEDAVTLLRAKLTEEATDGQEAD